MQPRSRSNLALAVILGAAGLWLALRDDSSAGGMLSGGTLAPEADDEPTGTPEVRFDPPNELWPELVEHRIAEEHEPEAAAPPEEREEPSGFGTKELSFVTRPEPGAFDGPLARDFFESGGPRWEAQQIQREDGLWILDGDWTAWHENGQIMERGDYREHEEQGLWEWWDENGVQIARGRFESGERVGPWTFWYEDGIKQLDGFYVDGVGEGHWVLYHENGLKCAEGEFKGGEIDGRWAIWNEDGTINTERSGFYEVGARVGD